MNAHAEIAACFHPGNRIPKIYDPADEHGAEHTMTDEDSGELQETDIETDAYSESESEEDVDPAVQEDMEKFEASFKGIKDRYRLINRIGEGKSAGGMLQ